MTKPISNKTLQYLEEFNQNGFIRVDAHNQCNRYAVNILRLSQNIRFFKSGIAKKSKGSTKYSAFNFFGQIKLTFLYDIERKNIFINYLQSLFYGKNSNPSESLCNAFHRLLSSNYLISKDYNQRIKYE